MTGATAATPAVTPAVTTPAVWKKCGHERSPYSTRTDGGGCTWCHREAKWRYAFRNAGTSRRLDACRRYNYSDKGRERDARRRAYLWNLSHPAGPEFSER